MRLFSDSIGRKVLMAITGLLMVLFVVGHLLGNLTIFAGPNGINAYAQHLHELAPVVWGTRLVMGAAVLIHLFLSVQITMENTQAKPEKYAVRNALRATFASQTMIWTGVIMGAFIVYHLLQFTLRVTPGLTLGSDALNRFDVFSMVVDGLGRTLTAFVYVVSMVSLFLHMSHGIQSAFQTLGLSNARWLPRFTATGKLVAGVFLVGFGAIPVAIVVGILTK
jgi:succinate dehydrogenase / fumarate reductase, cytochrome b subunit